MTCTAGARRRRRHRCTASRTSTLFQPPQRLCVDPKRRPPIPAFAVDSQLACVPVRCPSLTLRVLHARPCTRCTARRLPLASSARSPMPPCSRRGSSRPRAKRLLKYVPGSPAQLVRHRAAVSLRTMALPVPSLLYCLLSPVPRVAAYQLLGWRPGSHFLASAPSPASSIRAQDPAEAAMDVDMRISGLIVPPPTPSEMLLDLNRRGR